MDGFSNGKLCKALLERFLLTDTMLVIFVIYSIGVSILEVNMQITNRKYLSIRFIRFYKKPWNLNLILFFLIKKSLI